MLYFLFAFLHRKRASREGEKGTKMGLFRPPPTFVPKIFPVLHKGEVTLKAGERRMLKRNFSLPERRREKREDERGRRRGKKMICTVSNASHH